MKRQIFLGDAVFCVAVGFLTGILAVSFGWNLFAFIVWTLLGFGVAVALSFFTTFEAVQPIRAFIASPGKLAVIAGICLVGFFFGAFYYRFNLAWQAQHTKLPTGKTVIFNAIISDEPTVSKQSILLPVVLEKPYSGTITVFAPQNSNYGYGDELSIEGSVTAPKIAGQNPAIFPKRIKLVGQHKAFWLREKLINLKLAIIEKFNGVLPADEAMLLGGIAFGAKQNFKPDLKNAMAMSGTTHLVAISGYNITIVIVAAEGLLGGLVSRRAKFFITIALIILFVLMTGLQSSAIRAAIMGFLALTAKQSGRIFSMRNAITLTGAFMVALNPLALAHDVGFQLSFLSLIGIVCLCDPLKQIFQKIFHYEDNGILDWKESAVTTFSAQLGTMPALIAIFNQFSLTAIFANVLVLGTVPVTMLLGLLLAVFGFVSYYLAFFLAKITWLLLAYQLAVIRLFAALAVPLPIQFNSTLVFVVYYAALAWFAFSYRKPPSKNVTKQSHGK